MTLRDVRRVGGQVTRLFVADRRARSLGLVMCIQLTSISRRQGVESRREEESQILRGMNERPKQDHVILMKALRASATISGGGVYIFGPGK